jgi:hypothetical protein
MGLADIDYTKPELDPNAPTVPWGTGQVQMPPNPYATPNRDANDAAALARLQTASAEAPTIFPKVPGAPGQAGQQPEAPFRRFAQPAAYATTPAHDVQLGSDVGMKAKLDALASAKQAVGSLGDAQVEENENNQQAQVGYQGTVRGLQMEQDAANAPELAKMRKALEGSEKASEIDPNHLQSTMSTGRRIGLMAATGLTALGMGMMKQGGPNPITQMIEEETKRDIDAQKSNRDKKLSVYHNAREQGLTEMQAHALTYQQKAQMAKLGLDAAVAGNHSPVLTAQAEQHKAIIDDATADYLNKAVGRAQPQTVATGEGGPTEKEIRAFAEKIRLSPNYKGTDAYAEAARQLHAGAGGPQAEWEDAEAVKAAGAAKVAGAGRSAGVQMEHKRLLGRYDSAIDQIDQAVKHINGGYGDYHVGEDDKWGGIRANIASEVGFLMHGGAAEGAVKQQLEHLGDLNPTPIPGRQAVTGHPTVTALQALRQQLALKKDQEEKAGLAVQGGEGFGTSPSDDATMAAAGAVAR